MGYKGVMKKIYVVTVHLSGTEPKMLMAFSSLAMAGKYKRAYEGEIEELEGIACKYFPPGSEHTKLGSNTYDLAHKKIKKSQVLTKNIDPFHFIYSEPAIYCILHPVKFKDKKYGK